MLYEVITILSVIGGFFIVTKHFPEMDIAKFWPVLVILGGFMLFFKKPGACCKRSFRSTDSVDNDVIEEIAVFGGGSRIVESQNFKGGSVIAVFGGSDLSLEKCTLSTEGATLELIAVFGGSKLLIPRGWNVKTEVVSIFGGFDDKRTVITSYSIHYTKLYDVLSKPSYMQGDLYTPSEGNNTVAILWAGKYRAINAANEYIRDIEYMRDAVGTEAMSNDRYDHYIGNAKFIRARSYMDLCLFFNRITSYNVCYTKLLRINCI